MRGIAVARKLSLLNIIFLIIAVLITFTTLLFYGFIREGAALILLLLIIPVFYYIGYLNSLVFSISFLIITLSLNFVISKVGIRDLIYYEPNTVLEIFDYQLGQLIYAPKSKFEAPLKFGDLKAINPFLACDLQPREMDFRTDSFGFRNDADYHGQKYLVVGDSFVVGLSNTQKDTLSSQLHNTYNLEVPRISPAMPAISAPSRGDMAGILRCLCSCLKATIFRKDTPGKRKRRSSLRLSAVT
jgi:hypothetical protein